MLSKPAQNENNLNLSSLDDYTPGSILEGNPKVKQIPKPALKSIQNFNTMVGDFSNMALEKVPKSALKSIRGFNTVEVGKMVPRKVRISDKSNPPSPVLGMVPEPTQTKIFELEVLADYTPVSISEEFGDSGGVSESINVSSPGLELLTKPALEKNLFLNSVLE